MQDPCSFTLCTKKQCYTVDFEAQHQSDDPLSYRLFSGHTAMKVMGKTENLSLQSSYEQYVLRQVQRVLLDLSHILHSEYDL